MAVFVGPTREEIRVAQESLTDDEYASWVDHGTYYAYQVGKEIDGIGVRVVHSKELLLYFSLSGRTQLR